MTPNKLPLVRTDYPEEVHLISFEKIKNWKYSFYTGFAWDDISDEMISEALSYDDVTSVDLSVDWQDDEFIRNNKAEILSDDDILNRQAIRVAAIITLIQDGGAIDPVDFDTYCMATCCSSISDGHHRIRALQYLGYTHFPAYLNGEVRLFKCLISRKVDMKLKFVRQTIEEENIDCFNEPII